MSQLYSRVFVTILDSSIAEDYSLRHIFEDFLKLADHKTGVVDITRQVLSRRLNIPPEVLNPAIDKLEQPDPNSRDPEFDGRRLEKIGMSIEIGAMAYFELVEIRINKNSRGCNSSGYETS